MQKKTSPGIDNISYDLVKNLPKCSYRALLNLYNKIWETGNFPKAWTHAVVTQVLKNGKNPQELKSYRPICLTPVLGKVMERLVTDRLNWHLE